MKPVTKFLVPALVASLALTGCATSGDGAGGEQEPLIVQFVPTRTDDDMQAKAKPLADLLSEQLDREVEVTIATDYATIVEAMASGQVDVGIMPPASYVLAHQQGAADAVLQAQIPAVDPETAEPTDELVDGFHGEIVVAADSGIETLQDLRGRSIAAQSAASASGYIFPVVDIADAGLNIHNDLTLTTVSGIDSALLSVLNGETDAAFGFEGSRILLAGEFPDITDRLKVMHLTEATIPNDAIAVSTQVDEADRTAITEAFLAIAEDPVGSETVASLYSHRGYVVADPEAYAIVEEYTARASEL